MEKLCKACAVSKPTTEFHKDKSKTDGLNAYCKPCTIKRQREFSVRPPKDVQPEGFKKCQTCKEVLPLERFFKLALSHDGYGKKCKACAYAFHDRWRKQNLAGVAERMRKARARDPERFKDYGRKQYYGLGPGQYAKMLADQNNQCAICQTAEPGGKGSFHVDHCHDSGKIRGLLCHNCNLLIGHAKEKMEVLQSAIEYLKKEGGI